MEKKISEEQQKGIMTLETIIDNDVVFHYWSHRNLQINF